MGCFPQDSSPVASITFKKIPVPRSILRQPAMGFAGRRATGRGFQFASGEDAAEALQ